MVGGLRSRVGVADVVDVVVGDVVLPEDDPGGCGIKEDPGVVADDVVLLDDGGIVGDLQPDGDVAVDGIEPDNVARRRNIEPARRVLPDDVSERTVVRPGEIDAPRAVAGQRVGLDEIAVRAGGVQVDADVEAVGDGIARDGVGFGRDQHAVRGRVDGVGRDGVLSGIDLDRVPAGVGIVQDVVGDPGEPRLDVDPDIADPGKAVGRDHRAVGVGQPDAVIGVGDADIFDQDVGAR